MFSAVSIVIDLTSVELRMFTAAKNLGHFYIFLQYVLLANHKLFGSMPELLGQILLPVLDREIR